MPTQSYSKNLKKKYQEKWENAYLTVKNARASNALRWALHYGQYSFTLLAWLHFAMSAKSQTKFLSPTFTFLDPTVGRCPPPPWKLNKLRTLPSPSFGCGDNLANLNSLEIDITKITTQCQNNKSKKLFVTTKQPAFVMMCSHQHCCWKDAFEHNHTIYIFWTVCWPKWTFSQICLFRSTSFVTCVTKMSFERLQGICTLTKWYFK